MRKSFINDFLEFALELNPIEEQQSKFKARMAAKEVNRAAIQIDPYDGAILKSLLKIHASKKVVEFGTLTGLSSLWILEALGCEGFLWTFEKDPVIAAKAAEVLSENSKNFQVVVGDAKITSQTIESSAPFDAVFIDADKSSYPFYLSWAEKNLKKGGLLVADNIFLHGDIGLTFPSSGEADLSKGTHFSKSQILAMKEFVTQCANKEVWESLIYPSSDGFLVALKR